MRRKTYVVAALIFLAALLVPGSASAKKPPITPKTGWFTQSGPGESVIGVQVAKQGKGFAVGLHFVLDGVGQCSDGGTGYFPLLVAKTVIFSETPYKVGLIPLKAGKFSFHATLTSVDSSATYDVTGVFSSASSVRGSIAVSNQQFPAAPGVVCNSGDVAYAAHFTKTAPRF